MLAPMLLLRQHPIIPFLSLSLEPLLLIPQHHSLITLLSLPLTNAVPGPTVELSFALESGMVLMTNLVFLTLFSPFMLN